MAKNIVNDKFQSLTLTWLDEYKKTSCKLSLTIF